MILILKETKVDEKSHNDILIYCNEIKTHGVNFFGVRCENIYLHHIMVQAKIKLRIIMEVKIWQ